MADHYLTDAEIAAKLADILFLYTGSSALGSNWTSIVSDSHDAAYNEIVSTLVGRGYILSQIDTWDRREEYERDLSLFWCLVNGKFDFVEDDNLLKQLDRREGLAAVVVTVAGELIEPPEEEGETGVGHGEMDTENDLFVMDPNNPRLGRVTRW